ncbi:MAG TPA: hypothetical protein VGR48_05875, partial [Terriglobales bacterium]|nr:hypothetical protein [Terriglobales bacterium]
MIRTGTKFGRKMEEAIAALLTQRNVEEAANSIGVATKTLLRWMKEPVFQKAYREARRSAYSQAIARLQQGTTAAATTLLKLLIEPGTPASVKVRAAEAIFNHAYKAIEIEDVEARVAALERATEAA